MGFLPKISPVLFEALNNLSLNEIVIIRDVSDYSLEKNALSNIMSS